MLPFREKNNWEHFDSALFCPVCAEACAGKFAGCSKIWGLQKIGRTVKSDWIGPDRIELHELVRFYGLNGLVLVPKNRALGSTVRFCFFLFQNRDLN